MHYSILTKKPDCAGLCVFVLVSMVIAALCAVSRLKGDPHCAPDGASRGRLRCLTVCLALVSCLRSGPFRVLRDGPTQALANKADTGEWGCMRKILSSSHESLQSREGDSHPFTRLRSLPPSSASGGLWTGRQGINPSQ